MGPKYNDLDFCGVSAKRTAVDLSPHGKDRYQEKPSQPRDENQEAGNLGKNLMLRNLE